MPLSTDDGTYALVGTTNGVGVMAALYNDRDGNNAALSAYTCHDRPSTTTSTIFSTNGLFLTNTHLGLTASPSTQSISDCKSGNFSLLRPFRKYCFSFSSNPALAPGP